MPFLIVCLVGLLVSVHASPVSPPVVEGQVRLADGSPVAGAQVVLFDVADLRRGPVGKATTDEAGKFALPLAAGGAFVLPQAVGLGAKLSQSVQSLDADSLSIGGAFAGAVGGVQHLGSAGGDAGGWPAARGGGVCGAVGWHECVGSGRRLGGVFLPFDGGGGALDGEDGAVGWTGGGAAGRASVAAVPLAAGSTATYGLVVSGEGLVTYVDADFGVAAGQGPVELVVSAEPRVRMKVVVPTLAGLLGDVNADGHVDLDDGLLVAMYSVDPALSLPNHGLMTLGDVNCDGQVELADAGLIATYVVHPSAASVSSLRIGQRGGYSLDPVTEMVWGSILGTEQSDPTVARILDGVPVLLSGVRPVDGEDRLYLGIDRAYWTAQGGKQIYEALKQRFPATPIHVEPSIGMLGRWQRGRPRPHSEPWPR